MKTSKLLFLCLCLLAVALLALSVSAGTYGNLTYEIANGEVTITGCDEDASGALTIPNKISGYPVTSIMDRAFRGCDSLTSITIPSSVTSIGYGSFVACIDLTSITVNAANPNYSSDAQGVLYNKNKTTLICCPAGTTRTSITIPSSVTSIGEWAFLWCESLTSITIPSSVTSIGYGSFAACIDLTSITVNAANPNYSSDSQGVLYNKTKTTLICCPGGKTQCTIPSSVTSIGGGAFNGCDNLTSITIPSSVTSIGREAFYSCSSLSSITVNAANPNYSGDSQGVLYNKTKTTLLCCPGGKTACTIPSSVTSIGDWAFGDCYSLVSVTFAEGSQCTSIGEDAFAYCENLTSIEIPSSVTNIGDYAFEWCESLLSIEISSSVTSIGDDAFDGCERLTIVCAEGSYAQAYANEYGIPTANSVSEIAMEHIYGDLIYTVSHGEVTITGCDEDASGALTIPAEINGYPVTGIGEYAFKNCSKLTSIEIPSSVTNIGSWAFMWCKSLTSITIPSSVTSIGYGSFAACIDLTSITVNAANPNYSSDAQGVLYNKDKTTLLCCPGGKTQCTIPSSVTSIGSWAFMWCESLTSITIPSSVTSIGWWPFAGCINLTSITVNAANPNYSSDAQGILYNKDKTTLLCCPGGKSACTIPSSVTSIGTGAFVGCDNLTSITIPSSVKSIEESAFQACDGLTTITIPASVTEIEYNVFRESGNLQKVSVASGNPNYSSDAQGVLYNKDKTLLIAVPCALTSVTIPSTVKTISYDAFHASEIRSLTIPASVTSIESYAFIFCHDLFYIEIPSSVTYIEEEAFDDCENLTIVCAEGSYAQAYANEYGIPTAKSVDEIPQANVPKVVLTIGSTTVTVDGVNYIVDVVPIFENDDVYVPIRFAAEALNLNVSWDGTTSTLTLFNAQKELRMTVGSSIAYLNGYPRTTAPMQIRNSRTVVPLTAILDAFEQPWVWNGEKQTLTFGGGLHTHSMTKTAAKAATCTTAGNNAYYTCSTCGKVFKDAAGTTETTVAAESIAKLGHNMIQIPAKAPTAAAPGNNAYYTCDNCGKAFKDAAGTIETTPEAERLTFGLTIGRKTARAGETVAIPLTIGAPALKSIALAGFTYDESALELIGGEWKLSDAFIADWDAGNRAAAAAFAESVNLSGEIFVLTFKVKETAADGVYPIGCSVTAKNESVDIELPVTAGALEVISALPGDVNEDGEVTSDDAIYLLYHTLLGNMYPVSQPVDFNGDGEVTSDDAIYLLYYTLLGNMYPLH